MLQLGFGLIGSSACSKTALNTSAFLLQVFELVVQDLGLRGKGVGFVVKGVLA